MTKRDYIEFGDRTTPIAYFITFRTYGTWLHGDERGSVDRRYHNRVGTPKMGKNSGLVQRERELLKHPPVVLDAVQRQSVEATVIEVCRVRGYGLQAINVRSNHVHVVVDAADKPEQIMRSFKAYATRNLRQADLLNAETEPWSRHGSTLYLWAEKDVNRAVQYVLFGQDGDVFIKAGQVEANKDKR